jgi:hypothetical protein
MEKQGSSLAKSCFFQIRNIGRIRPYISNDACKTLFSTLVTSRFDSGNALSFGVNATLIMKLERIENTAARLITRTKKCEHITQVCSHGFTLPQTTGHSQSQTEMSQGSRIMFCMRHSRCMVLYAQCS